MGNNTVFYSGTGTINSVPVWAGTGQTFLHGTRLGVIGKLTLMRHTFGLKREIDIGAGRRDISCLPPWIPVGVVPRQNCRTVP